MKKALISLCAVLAIIMVAVCASYNHQFSSSTAKAVLDKKYFPMKFYVTEKIDSEDYYVLYAAQPNGDPKITFKVGVRRFGDDMVLKAKFSDDYIAVVKNAVLNRILKDKTFDVESQSDVPDVSGQIYDVMQELKAWLDLYGIQTTKFTPSCTLRISICGEDEEIQFLVMDREIITKNIYSAYLEHAEER